MFIEVRRDDLRSTRVVDSTPTLGDGGALLRADRFALTANNVTYAAFGDLMQCWSFFPASEDGWGRVPVWGFAEVEQRRAEWGGDGFGERVPMADGCRSHDRSGFDGDHHVVALAWLRPCGDARERYPSRRLLLPHLS